MRFPLGAAAAAASSRLLGLAGVGMRLEHAAGLVRQRKLAELVGHVARQLDEALLPPLSVWCEKLGHCGRALRQR